MALNEKQQEHLHNLRHSLAHILAAAITRLYDNVKFGTGPVTEQGFFYDIDMTHRLAPEDLKRIEKEMRKIIRADYPFERSELTTKEAKERFSELNQSYKVELIEGLENEGTKEVSLYQTGEFVDLCRGGHVSRSSEIPEDCFSLTRIAGAYWKSDEKREQLQRITGIAFASKADLDAYETMLKEAEKRDHRKLGKELDLFTFSDLVGPGLPLWTPKGTTFRTILDEFVWTLRKAKAYEKVTIPHITKKALYETSGHWKKFSEELFKVGTREGKEYALKPMNCPHHTQIFDHLPRSYRHMPQRYAETTMVYRDEQSGELGGLTRVLSITQDDAHVFCRTNQIKEEFFAVWDIIDAFYTTFGFTFETVRLSFHDPKTPEKYLGDESIWKKAEDMLQEIAKERHVPFVEAPGEAALYGPKIDFIAKDSIGREHQVATIQLDMNLPEQFDLSCTNEEGKSERIVMIHCAIMGSLERFIAVLIEHYAGAFPLWLSPIQIAVLPLSEKFLDYAQTVTQKLKDQGIRVELHNENDSLGKRIREAQKQKIPAMLILGEKEVSDQTVTLRRRDKEEQNVLTLDALIKGLQKEIQSRA